MLCLDLLLVIDESNNASSRLVRVPASYSMMELHFIVSLLCKYEPTSQAWHMDSQRPRGGPGEFNYHASQEGTSYRLPSRYMPGGAEGDDARSDSSENSDDSFSGEEDTYRGNGIIISGSSFMMNDLLDWYKDARTYQLQDVFDNSITHVKYEYSDSKNLGCTITAIASAEERDGALPLILAIDGPSITYTGQYSRVRAPQVASSQKKLDTLFSGRLTPAHSRSKCTFCRFVGVAGCELPLGRGCSLHSGQRCCAYCAGNQAFSDVPLPEASLPAHIATLQAAEYAVYEARVAQGNANFNSAMSDADFAAMATMNPELAAELRRTPEERRARYAV